MTASIWRHSFLVAQGSPASSQPPARLDDLAWINERQFEHMQPPDSSYRRQRHVDRRPSALRATGVALAVLMPLLAATMATAVEQAEEFVDGLRDRVVRAYWLALEKGAPGEVYNVGSGVTRTIQSMLDLLLSMSKVPIEVRTDPTRMRPSDVRILWSNSDKFKAQTGWEPKIPFERTLLDLLNYWRERV